MDSVPQLGQTLPPAPTPNESVRAYETIAKKPATVKPAGAYRPPGARGLATPSIFKREDEGGVPHKQANGNGSGTTTPTRGYRSGPPPGAPGHGQHANGHGPHGRRQVPGAAPGGPASEPNDKKNKKRKGGKKDGAENGEVDESGTPVAQNKGNKKVAVVEEATPVEEPVLDVALDAIAKKVRNLNKKV